MHYRGSHVEREHADGSKIVLPFHDEVDRYTLKGVLQDAGIEADAITQLQTLTDAAQELIYPTKIYPTNRQQNETERV